MHDFREIWQLTHIHILQVVNITFPITILYMYMYVPGRPNADIINVLPPGYCLPSDSIMISARVIARVHTTPIAGVHTHVVRFLLSTSGRCILHEYRAFYKYSLDHRYFGIGWGVWGETKENSKSWWRLSPVGGQTAERILTKLSEVTNDGVPTVPHQKNLKKTHVVTLGECWKKCILAIFRPL